LDPVVLFEQINIKFGWVLSKALLTKSFNVSTNGLASASITVFLYPDDTPSRYTMILVGGNLLMVTNSLIALMNTYATMVDKSSPEPNSFTVDQYLLNDLLIVAQNVKIPCFFAAPL